MHTQTINCLFFPVQHRIISFVAKIVISDEKRIDYNNTNRSTSRKVSKSKWNLLESFDRF